MSQTFLGPWKFDLDMGRLSHQGSNIVPDQEANGDKLGNFFRSSRH